MKQWFRLYVDVARDPKVQRLPAELFRAWINLLCLACEHDGVLPDAADVAYHLRVPAARAQTILDALEARGLLDRSDGGLAPHNWAGRQFLSDTSTDRVRRFRSHETPEKRFTNVSEMDSQRHRNVSRNVSETFLKRPQSRPEQSRPEQTQTHTQSEAERDARARRPPADADADGDGDADVERVRAAMCGAIPGRRIGRDDPLPAELLATAREMGGDCDSLVDFIGAQRDRGFGSHGVWFRLIREDYVPAPPPAPEPWRANPDCARCHGSGWIYVERGGLSGADPCDCGVSDGAARQPRTEPGGDPPVAAAGERSGSGLAPAADSPLLRRLAACGGKPPESE